MIYKYFDRKHSRSDIENEKMSDQQLAKEIRKPILRKFKKRKVHSPFRDNIWGADLADKQLINRFNQLICFFITSYYELLILQT